MKMMRSLYFWILLAFLFACLLGVNYPQLAIKMEPLGSTFVKLIKLLISPTVFLTVSIGIAQTGSLKKLGKISIKAFIYFEFISTIALLMGWAAASIIKPGALLHAHTSQLDHQAVAGFLQSSTNKPALVDFLQHLIPANFVEPFLKGDLLQVLFIAILFGIALLGIKENQSKAIVNGMNNILHCMFQMIRMVMILAPLGVFGATAFTIAKFGGQFIVPLLGLMGTFYFTGCLFVFIILGLIARLSGFSILSFIRYISPELFLVLGTSSSESGLPQLMKKLENLGCKKETVGVVVPMGYSFNLDGTNIYMTLAALFIAQALDIHLTVAQQFILFATAMLTSKGAAGITGAGFITLAATLAVVPAIPPVGMVLILGVDRFMSEARCIINYIGNGVAALAISRWENEISGQALHQALLTKETSSRSALLAEAAQKLLRDL